MLPHFGCSRIGATDDWVDRMPNLVNFDDPMLEIRYSLRRADAEARRIRALILNLHDSGVYSQRQLASELDVSRRTIGNWLTLARSERDDVLPQ